MDVIERLERTKKLRVVFYLYAAFTYINLFIHVENYYQGFLSEHMEYFLYAAKIVICLSVIMVFNKNRIERYRGIVPIMKLMIVFDVMEFVISALMTSYKTGIALKILLVPMVLKVFLDFFFYWEILNKKDKFVWIALNLLILVCCFFSMKIKGILLFVVMFAAVRVVLSLIFIKISRDSEDSTDIWTGISDIHFPKWLRIAAVSVYALMIFVFAFLCLYKPIGNKELTSVEEGGGYKEFAVQNLMSTLGPHPWSTGFERTWYGLMDANDELITKPKYTHWLGYDYNGIAWDYKGHFIDRKGNTVISVPYIVSAKRSVRTSVFNSVFSFLTGGKYEERDLIYLMNNIGYSMADEDFYVAWDDSNLSGNTFKVYTNIDRYGEVAFEVEGSQYFFNHITVFYSEVKGAYGLMNDQGEIIVKPCIYDFSYIGPEIMEVNMRDVGNANVLTQNGEFLFDKYNSFYSIKCDRENELLWGVNEMFYIGYRNNNDNAIFDFSGKEIYSGFRYCEGVTDDGTIIITKYEDGKWFEIGLDLNGNELYREERN